MTHKIPVTNIDSWIHEKIQGQGEKLTRGDLTRYQMARFKETLDFAMAHSPFYRKKLAWFARKQIRKPSDINILPFTYPHDIRNAPLDFISVSQGEISRAVSLKTSGTTASPKRIFFTEADLALTEDYFAVAMADFVGPGSTVMIFLPGDQPASIGGLLRSALSRIGAEAITPGPVTDPENARDLITCRRPDCLIGIPTQILQLARDERVGKIPGNSIKNVILTADYVPSPITAAIQSAWGCRVFSHYGMTEMGYAGGVECLAAQGYHFREADLYLEIIDPATGKPAKDGRAGEVVFTTLTRRGMPLIRYRTGDKARFLTDPCPCGTALKRMEPVRGRRAGGIRLKNETVLTIPALDEALFSLPGLLNYSAKIADGSGADTLGISLLTASPDDRTTVHAAERVVSKIPVIQEAIASGALKMGGFGTDCTPISTTGMIKRTLTDQRVS